MCTINFKLCASEPDTVSDLMFLAKFDALFFADHPGLIDATDKSIGEMGHLVLPHKRQGAQRHHEGIGSWNYLGTPHQCQVFKSFGAAEPCSRGK
jgi:hypothetical protein